MKERMESGESVLIPCRKHSLKLSFKGSYNLFMEHKGKTHLQYLLLHTALVNDFHTHTHSKHRKDACLYMCTEIFLTLW